MPETGLIFVWGGGGGGWEVKKGWRVVVDGWTRGGGSNGLRVRCWGKEMGVGICYDKDENEDEAEDEEEDVMLGR